MICKAYQILMMVLMQLKINVIAWAKDKRWIRHACYTIMTLRGIVSFAAVLMFLCYELVFDDTETDDKLNYVGNIMNMVVSYISNISIPIGWIPATKAYFLQSQMMFTLRMAMKFIGQYRVHSLHPPLPNCFLNCRYPLPESLRGSRCPGRL